MEYHYTCVYICLTNMILGDAIYVSQKLRITREDPELLHNKQVELKSR